MKWFNNQTHLLELENSPHRKNWMESKAYEEYFEIEWKMEKEMRNPARIGALGVFEITGAEGKNCWMVPIEGHKKLLSPTSQVRLLEKDGTVFFSGAWGNTELHEIQKRIEFFIWLRPKNREEAEIPFTTKLKGMYRLLKHKLRPPRRPK